MPVSRSRYAAVLLPFALVVAALTLVAVLSVSIMSTLRAYVGGESHWSKGQKAAVAALQRYLVTGDELDYRQFQADLAVPLADMRARREMDRAQPDYPLVYQAMLAGHNADEDIRGMYWLYRNFKDVYLMKRAIRFWQESDAPLLRLQQLGLQAHGEQKAAPQQVMLALRDTDRHLTLLAEGFAGAVNEAARQVRLALLAVLALFAASLLAVSHWYLRRSFARGDRLQAQLRQSEERLRLGFAGSNAGLWDWDVERGEVYYSRWLCQLLGHPDSEFRTEPDRFPGTLHEADRQQMRQAIRAHIVQGVPFDVEFRVQDSAGNWLWCRANGEAVRDARGRAVRMAGSIIDITDRKRAEAQAFAEKELAEVTLASIADAVIATDQAGNVSYCNRNAERMLGQPLAQLAGQPLELVCRLVGEDGAAAAPDAALYLQGAQGGLMPVDRSAAPIHAPDGQVIGQVVVLHDASEARRHAAQLSYQATHDELTDILNRREFERRLRELLASQSGMPGSEHALLYLDLDRFKIINDTSGHAAGDELIRQVSQLLQATLRERDIVGRLGGDEFGIVLAHCSHDDALRVADKVRQAVVELHFHWGVRSYRIGVSIGVVLVDGSTTSLKEVMKAADAACYMAKEKGRNRIHLFSEHDAELSVRHTEMECVSRIRSALEHDRFVLHLQTIAPLRAGAQRHAEVLLRMLDEQGALQPPMSFIPAAERYDLMPLLDRWVIRHAFQALAQQPPGTVWAINLSGASVCDESLLDYVLAQQRASGIALESVCFEVTETVAVANLAQASALIQELQASGCRFALDDFGAGMSSFAYLKHLPVDYVKIDGSFIRGILHSPTDRAMVESINQIAHVMGKQTIAECVEEEAVLALLRELGIDFAQGYGIGRPQPLSSWQAANKAANARQIDALS